MDWFIDWFYNISTLVELSNDKVSLVIIVFNYIQYKNEHLQSFSTDKHFTSSLNTNTLKTNECSVQSF